MEREINEAWMIEMMRKNDWCLGTIVFAYPDGIEKSELGAAEGEKVVASITDVLYLSMRAVYVRDKRGKYSRIPWGDIDEEVWSLRKLKGETVQGISYRTTDGRLIGTPLPFAFVPGYFGQMHDRCCTELTSGGRRCKLPGPARFALYAKPPAEGAAWMQSLMRNKTLWVGELICPCDERNFALRYLGRLLEGGTIADGELRQRLVGTCTKCGNELEIFDSFRHGYNAVICGENKSEPAGREAVAPYNCGCGGNAFSLGVTAIYDADSEDLAGCRKDKRSEAYGSIGVYATCCECQRVTLTVNYETA